MSNVFLKGVGSIVFCFLVSFVCLFVLGDGIKDKRDLGKEKSKRMKDEISVILWVRGRHGRNIGPVKSEE